MSYDRIGNWRIRDRGIKVNIFDKVNEVKRDLQALLPEIEGDRLIAMFSKIRTYVAHKKKGVPLGRKGLKGYRKLTPAESILYEYIIKRKMSPSTTYRWFLATRIPEDVKEKMNKGQLSVKKAMEISANRRRVKMSKQGFYLMEDIRLIVRGL